MRIEFNKVTMRYASGQDALNQVSFVLDKGEMAFLTGHSGAGKTTVLKLIALLERKYLGQIFLSGKNIQQLKGKDIPYIRSLIGLIFQDPHLLYDRSVFDNVALPLILSGVHRREIKSRVNVALDKVGLIRKEKLNPQTLSSGEQQRVGIARAIVHRPLLLLADEPTGNLDPLLAIEIMNIFRSLNQLGATILIASHDLSLIARLPYRILTLKNGRLLQEIYA